MDKNTECGAAHEVAPHSVFLMVDQILLVMGFHARSLMIPSR